SSFVFFLNIVAASIYLSGILLLTPVYGVIVPPALWLFINVLQIAPMVAMTHRRTLRGEAQIWFKEDFLPPTLLALGMATVSRYIAPTTISWFVTVPWLAGSYIITVAAILLLSNRSRPLLSALWSRWPIRLRL